MKRSLICCLFTVSLCIATTAVRAQNLLVNGALDAGTGGSAGDPGTNPPWTLTNTGDPTAAQFQSGFANSTGGTGLGVWYRSFLGNTTNGGVGSTLSQSATAAMAGKYVLTFDAVVEQNFNAQSLVASLTSSNGPSASLDLLLERIPAGSTYTGGGFANIGLATPPYNIQKMLMVDGVTAGASLTVSIVMTNGMGGVPNPQSTVIDNFNLRLIPEPSSLVLAGWGLIGALGLLRRR